MLGSALLLAVVLVAPLGTGPLGHYVPQAGDTFRFDETIGVNDGTGNYSGYTEEDVLSGWLNVTAVLPNGTETAKYNYSGTYTNSSGADYSWDENGTFTFSATTFRYVAGTDNQSGEEGSGLWFYMNNSLGVGAEFSILSTPMTVRSLQATYDDPSTGKNVRAILTVGTGTYVRDDSYGVFNASYDWQSYFDPSTGYILGYDYVEEDTNARGDGFLYTDQLSVTSTSYPLTPAPPAPTYLVTFEQTGLPTGSLWTVTFDGIGYAGSGPSVSVGEYPNGTYLYRVSSAGYSVIPSTGWLTVSGTATQGTVQFSAASSSGGLPAWLWVVVALAVVVVVVLVVLALARRSRRAHPLPSHSSGGQVRYGPPPPPGPAPPPISLRPGDQPQIQQVVVKEVVKVNCRYCGSLIDSTAEKCPFCGATRS